MNPFRASERLELRRALGSDEAVASYVSEMKGRELRFNHLMYSERPVAHDARHIIDATMSGSLTDLLYKSREDHAK